MKIALPVFISIAIVLGTPTSVLAQGHFGHFGHGGAIGHAWHGGDIHSFARGDLGVWRGGAWRHGWHDGNLGWWWVVGGLWYFYPAPIYPYPDPYLPADVIEEEAPPPVVEQTPPPAAAAPQFWYYCASAKGYYPYVSSCPEAWQKVPTTPPGAPR